MKTNIEHRSASGTGQSNAERRREARTVVFASNSGRTNAQYRPFVERMVWMAKKLRDGEPLNCRIASRYFEVSTKTIFRDLEFLRDRLCYDFEFDVARNSYVLRVAPEAVL